MAEIEDCAVPELKSLKMRNKPDHNIIRIGDKVKIVKPNFFVRCGYDNNHKSACEYVKEKYCDLITKFILAFEDAPKLYSMALSVKDIIESQLAAKIISAMAYERVGNLRESGMERKIFTRQEEIWLLRGRTFIVNGIFFCKTGTYYRPSGGYDSWTGEYDYDPGGLSNAKTHKILLLADIPIVVSSSDIGNAIEAVNVRKVK